MTLFVSSPKQLGLQLIQGDKTLAKFEPVGRDFGQFYTEDDRKVQALKAHPDFGKRFFKFEGTGIPIFKEKYINHGIISTAGNLTAKEASELKEKAVREISEDTKAKYIRYGELKGKVVSKAGKLRSNASKVDTEEYLKLKDEFGG